jgi:hypothetical protein
VLYPRFNPSPISVKIGKTSRFSAHVLGGVVNKGIISGFQWPRRGSIQIPEN